MKIARIIKEASDPGDIYGCTGGNCPALLLTDDDQVIVQGLVLDSSMRSNIELPNGEDVVRMSVKTFRSLIDQLDQ